MLFVIVIVTVMIVVIAIVVYFQYVSTVVPVSDVVGGEICCGVL